jgi:hypothetical protein
MKGDRMSRQLPPRPNLEQLKKQARAILKGHRSATPEILQRRAREESQSNRRNAQRVKREKKVKKSRDRNEVNGCPTLVPTFFVGTGWGF